jgi:hypothetical protein
MIAHWKINQNRRASARDLESEGPPGNALLTIFKKALRLGIGLRSLARFFQKVSIVSNGSLRF